MSDVKELSCNALEIELKKPACEFTKADIISYVETKEITHINFMYPAQDGRLKTLNFIINDKDYLEEILTCGERVDGSSLFSFVQAGSSDLYVIPRFSTAFPDPFADEPTLTLLCEYFDKDGNMLSSSPSATLSRACKAFHEATGCDFEAMGELEYYVISEDTGSFPASDQHGYHESAPFAKFNNFRQRCMLYIAQVGGRVKYGHSEVGNFTLDGKIYEQNEIEFLPCPALSAAYQLLLAKWIIQNLAYENDMEVTFAPKITTGKAGSGLHIHMRIMKDGKNQMLENGVLSKLAKRAIAGLMRLAPSITAFGNTNPTSYFRLVPHQEAPTNICWGDRNRSVLVRVPLGWATGVDMCKAVNPLEESKVIGDLGKQTVEIRCPDGSADLFMLLAALAVALRYGYELPDGLEIADNTYVNVNIHAAENAEILKRLEQLPDCCAASSKCLAAQRSIYEQKGVFSPAMLDAVIKKLASFNDEQLRSQLQNDPTGLLNLVKKYFYV